MSTYLQVRHPLRNLEVLRRTGFSLTVFISLDFFIEPYIRIFLSRVPKGLRPNLNVSAYPVCSRSCDSRNTLFKDEYNIPRYLIDMWLHADLTDFTDYQPNYEAT